jgi:CheY-like chemotaxis protein
MLTYDAFAKEFKTALVRLHDPDYRPAEGLLNALGCPAHEGKAALWGLILAGIERLKPPADTPPSAYVALRYDLLHSRFQLKLTQEETAYQLNVSRRTVNRLQPSAIEALTVALWPQNAQIAPALPTAAPLLNETDWNTQLQREVHSLASKAPSVNAVVNEVIHDVLELLQAMPFTQPVTVKLISVQPNLVAPVHPVLLHQILLSALTHLATHVVKGEIALYARLENGNARISLAGAVAQPGLRKADLGRGLPTAKDVAVETLLEAERAYIWITTPAIGKVKVLVVDDNEDIVGFYRDATIGTRYHLVSIAQGGQLSAAVLDLAPDLIVLDIMLPDIDGWRLLMRLHEDPATRHIPVVVCTVIREEQLALALGAACYLAKPVRPAAFIGALDQLCPQAAEEVSRVSTNSERAERSKTLLPQQPP